MVFEVGDEVQVIVSKPRYGWGPVDPGDIGTIVGFSGDPEKVSTSVFINFPGKHSHWHALVREIDFVDHKRIEKQKEIRYQPII